MISHWLRSLWVTMKCLNLPRHSIVVISKCEKDWIILTSWFQVKCTPVKFWKNFFLSCSVLSFWFYVFIYKEELGRCHLIICNILKAFLIPSLTTGTLNTPNCSLDSRKCRTPFRTNWLTLTSGSPSTRQHSPTWRPPRWPACCRTSVAP